MKEFVSIERIFFLNLAFGQVHVGEKYKIYFIISENMKEHVIESRKTEIWNSIDEETKIVYGQKYFDNIYRSIIEGSNRYPDDLTCVIRAMRSGLLSKRPRNRYPCGTGAEFIMMIYPFLPVWLADKLMLFISIMPKGVRPAALD
jgi:hypothetical protein